jgi:hypothetical protein
MRIEISAARRKTPASKVSEGASQSARRELTINARDAERIDEVVRQTEGHALGHVEREALARSVSMRQIVRRPRARTFSKRQFRSTWTVSPDDESKRMFSP